MPTAISWAIDAEIGIRGKREFVSQFLRVSTSANPFYRFCGFGDERR